MIFLMPQDVEAEQVEEEVALNGHGLNPHLKFTWYNKIIVIINYKNIISFVAALIFCILINS